MIPFFHVGTPYFESDGRVWLVQQGLMPEGPASFRSFGADIDAGMVPTENLERIELLLHADANHGWFVIKLGRKHLVEWTGVRWRLRDDALPIGIKAKDLLDMSVAEGTEWAVTKYQLLRFGGVRFEAVSVSQGFAAQSLRAVSARELWTFAL